MGVEDQRDFVIFYGIVYNDWAVTFGKFIDHPGILTMDYIHIDCDCGEDTAASACTDSKYCITKEFIFPHHIKKQYYIEGVVEGEFTIACNGDDTDFYDYRISIWKTNADTTYERLAVTYMADSEWITINDTLTWDGVHSVGEEKVYHWFIDCWDAQELKEHDRLYLKIELRGNNDHLRLMHTNDPDWTDIWIKIPFRL